MNHKKQVPVTIQTGPIVVLIALPIVVSVLCMTAIFIAIDGGGPLYRQTRIGRRGRAFHMWKLRTMVRDADGALDQLLNSNTQARAAWKTVQKLKYDPRITHIAHILRRFSLDALPQIWNVLRGDMSLVGPRPIMPSQKDLYRGSSYVDLRPGLTGLWQIFSRNDLSLQARRRFDQEYARAVSLGLDLWILRRIFSVALRGKAY